MQRLKTVAYHLINEPYPPADATTSDGSVAVFRRFEPIILPLLFAFFLVMALLSHDPVDAGGSFYLCLTVGVAMLIGQRMLLRGVAVVTLLLLGVGAVCAGLRVDPTVGVRRAQLMPPGPLRGCGCSVWR